MTFNKEVVRNAICNRKTRFIQTVRHRASDVLTRLESYNFLQRSPLTDIFEPGFIAGIDPDQPIALQREAYRRAASASPVNRMMHLDLEFTLADNDLRKVSRMCEVAGVEVRYPLLDDALVEFSGEIPPSLKVKSNFLLIQGHLKSIGDSK